MTKSQLEVQVEWDRPITMAALAERLRQEGHGSEVLADVLRSREREIVDELCGPRYHPRPDTPFVRAGTKKGRTLGTVLGKIRIPLVKIRDRLSGDTFYPLFTDVLVQPRRIYQDDVVALAEQAAMRMTYRNTSEELGKVINGVPSAHTINRRMIEDGEALNKEIHERDLVAFTHQPDGTKVHGKDGKNKDVNVVLATAPGKKPRLRSLTVGKKWLEHRPAIERTRFETDGGEPVVPTVMSDFEKGLAELMIPPGGLILGDHVHVPRTLRFDLWSDGMKDGKERRKILKTAVGLLAHLRNSVKLHLPKGEKEAVEHRIKQTIKEMRRLATLLANDGWNTGAEFLRRVCIQVTTFATLALQGIVVPWHNNLVERLMAEVSKRCKHKWMSWTSRGGQALLTLLVVRTVEPDTHEEFWKRKLYGPGRHPHDLGIKVTSRKGWA